MKKSVAILLLILTYSVSGQIHLTPFVGLNSTRMTTGLFGYENGGNYIFGGIELEGRLKPKKISPFHLSVVTGVSYLNNGFFENSLFSFSSLVYTASRTDLTTQYVQIPLMVKLNWQPFPLVEDFYVFMGGGVSNNMLLKAHLAENYTTSILTFDIYSLPQTTHYEDSQDITQYGVKNSLFTRMDFGLRYKKIQIAFRLSLSTADMYYKGLENTWGVPATKSGYISGHTSAGSTKEKYSELVIGYRLF
jgi:predicted DNA binding CopG/RHH family protein